jgi:L,D-transpeptidase catalytic domain
MAIRIASLAPLLVAGVLATGPATGAALADASSGNSGSSSAPGSTTMHGSPGTTTNSPSSTSPAPPPAAKGTIRLYLRGAFFVHGAAVTVPGRAVSVQGVVRPYVAGQWVRVRSRVGRRLVKSDLLRIKPSANHAYGTFTERVASPAAGILRVSAVHTRTPQMLGFSALRAVAALAESIGFGSRGRFVQLMQQRLAALHIYLPQSGVYDQQMGLAVDAYHRLLGWGVSQSLGGATISALLNGRGSFPVRDPRDGKHVEGNLSKQLLALVDGSSVYRIYPISSGKPSTPTILGHFRVYRRTPGYLPDGMYYSNFFIGGYAIHGYSPAPDYAASHGCMRLPIIDAISVYDWLNFGDVVDVYH